GGGNLIFLLASGFATFPRAMVATGKFSAYAPDGTFLSTTDDYSPVATGEQANGGSIIVSGRPAGSCNGIEIVRFDDHFAKTSSGCTPGQGIPTPIYVLVDAQDRTLMVFVAQADGDVLAIPASHYGARWFDAAGKPLTDWFDAGSASGSRSFGLTPLIGGGVALAGGSGWVTIPSGATQVGSPPAGFMSEKGARIVLGGRAYAMTGTTPGTINIIEPGGKSCGALP